MLSVVLVGTVAIRRDDRSQKLGLSTTGEKDGSMEANSAPSAITLTYWHLPCPTSYLELQRQLLKIKHRLEIPRRLAIISFTKFGSANPRAWWICLTQYCIPSKSLVLGDQQRWSLLHLLRKWCIYACMHACTQTQRLVDQEFTYSCILSRFFVVVNTPVYNPPSTTMPVEARIKQMMAVISACQLEHKRTSYLQHWPRRKSAASFCCELKC